MEFLRSEFEFKAASRKIEHYLSTTPPTDTVRLADLVEILLPMAKLNGGKELISGAQRLADALNTAGHSTLSCSQIQQKLALAFARRQYQSLRESFGVPTAFRQLFPDALLPPSDLEPGERQRHPYPKELKRLRELASWHAVWEESAESTREHPFFPPMLPASCFPGFKPHYELRRDWRSTSGDRPQQFSHNFENGSCCVLVRRDGKHLVGAASWKWWGLFGHIRGVGFSLYLRSKAGWLKVFFDIRPYYPEPTCGPSVYRESSKRDADHIWASLEELIHLPIHRYSEDDDPTS